MGAVHLRVRCGSAWFASSATTFPATRRTEGRDRYSVLATSRDGIHWQRRREPFLDRDPARGSWDHAMTWIGAAVPVGDEVFFYYGGYARGHKVGRNRAANWSRPDEAGPLSGPGPSNDEGGS